MQNSIDAEFENNPEVVVAVFNEGGSHGETLDWVQLWWDNVALRGSIIWDETGAVGSGLYGQPSTNLPFGRGFIIDREGIVDTPYFGHQPEAAIARIYELLETGGPCDDLALVDRSVPTPLYIGDVDQGSISLWNCSDGPIDVEVAWPCPWLDVVPDQGTIPAQTTADLLLELDTSGLVPGPYSCPVSIAFSDTGEINFNVAVDVESPLSIIVTDHPVSVRRGGRLRWDFDVINDSDQSRTASAWFDAYLPSGNPHPSNPFSGPFSGTIPAGEGKSFSNFVAIPGNAPLGGPYRICNVIGAYPDLWIADCFEFEVLP